MYPIPFQRTARETARSFFKRTQNPDVDTEGRVHKSVSLENSRQWFAGRVAAQRKQGSLFEDPYMLADDTSVYRKAPRSYHQYEWRRPHQLTPDPKFIIDGISRFDVKQGEIGDCWFLAAVSSLSIHPELLEKVVPSGQSFSKKVSTTDGKTFPYCGMFWFRFWQFGEWVDVIVDDRLPARNGSLVFMHSSNRNEFWSALLEKAYAKMVGSYEAMRGGNTTEAMEDFTGGLTELVELGPRAPKKLFSIMERAHSRCSLMACSIDATPEEVETEGPKGLIMGHAYSVTDVRKLHNSGGSHQVELIRLRNPWGNDREWHGPWSDQSAEWNSISNSERKRIGLVFDHDGEFWMSFTDFARYFSRLEFCHLGPESGAFGQSFRQDASNRRWEMTKEEGEWIKYSTAGGCRNNERTFHINPQFRVQVIDPDETDDDNTGTIIVGLMQKGRREAFQQQHTIGYSIYRLPNNHPPDALLTRKFFETNVSVARSPTFANIREICGRHKLPPGDYMIIPSTFEPNLEAKFLLRIFSERPCVSNELDDKTNVGVNELTKRLSLTSLDDGLTTKLQEAFVSIAGPSGEITAAELQDILNVSFKDLPFRGFSRETARSMVALMDTDLSGSLGFQEFSKLWNDLRIWKAMFKNYDLDKNGTFDAFELREVMRAVGFQVSNRVYNAIMCRYADSQGRIEFDDYVLLLVRLSTVVETYKAQERLRAVFQVEDVSPTGLHLC
ncbi:hypothetical protein P879_07844 [Paragonimus westermani]|uniref:Calpain, invertebrate n=1 Tax=Paragonimus westermani TaxID=34504 RepID=A0A8T0CZX1_9TREM|nr:hypothetical protein P879_07844 [Paragonimus westermani]